MLYLSLGSNIADRREHLAAAVSEIENRIGHITKKSDIIETSPWGFDSPNQFLNQALEVDTVLTPEQVLEQTQAIESEMGRKEKSRDGLYKDRIIDIDLLMYGNHIINSDTLTLPHPLMTKRLFVLKPLAQIAPDALHPIINKSISELLSNLSYGRQLS